MKSFDKEMYPRHRLRGPVPLHTGSDAERIADAILAAGFRRAPTPPETDDVPTGEDHG